MLYRKFGSGLRQRRPSIGQITTAACRTGSAPNWTNCRISMKSSALESSRRALQVAANRRIQGRRGLLDGARAVALAATKRKDVVTTPEIASARRRRRRSTSSRRVMNRLTRRRWREQHTSRGCSLVPRPTELSAGPVAKKKTPSIMRRWREQKIVTGEEPRPKVNGAPARGAVAKRYSRHAAAASPDRRSSCPGGTHGTVQRTTTTSARTARLRRVSTSSCCALGQVRPVLRTPRPAPGRSPPGPAGTCSYSDGAGRSSAGG